MRTAKATLAVLVVSMTLSCQKIDRTKPPETGALPSFKLPATFETTLSNGLRLVLVNDGRFPQVTLRLGFEPGAKSDPKDLPGLAEAAGALLTEGTTTRPSKQIAEELAEMGGALKAGAGPDSLTIQGSVLAENLPKLLDLLADVTLNASFPEDEVKIYKTRRVQELLAERSEASFWADEKINAVVFGEHPYSRTNPTPQSIAKLDRKLMVQFRDQYLVPNNGILILLGAIPDQMTTVKLVADRLGSWRRKDVPAPPAPDFPPASRSITLMDRPGSVQADIRVGRLAVDRLSPDYFPLVVANTILGGGASSRMFTNIREKEGFAYDAQSNLQPRKNAGIFVAVTQVRNEVLEQAIKAVDGELETMATKPVTETELADVKNYLSGNFVMGLETQAGVANQLVAMKLLGLPANYLETFTARIRAVDAASIQAAARKYMPPARASLVVVGDASRIRAVLEKFGKVTVEKAGQ
jgi:zinc protease